MRKITLFIAMSLDGFIAGKDGDVNWLQGQDPDGEDMLSYLTFIKHIDTVIMGWNTYHQIAFELSPENWMYKNLTSYVLTHRHLPPEENIQFVNENVCELVQILRREPGDGIWICGGANIIQPLIKNHLIDEFYISIIPTLLGDGIRLFERADTEIKLKLKNTKTYHGITDVIYEYR